MQVVVSVTSFETESKAFNVIPQNVKLKGTVRTLDRDVRKLAEKWPEKKQRDRQWVSRRKAAKLVAEPELARILKDFDPRLWRGTTRAKA